MDSLLAVANKHESRAQATIKRIREYEVECELERAKGRRQVGTRHKFVLPSDEQEVISELDGRTTLAEKQAIAGFFDGDGCIHAYITEQRTMNIHASAVQAHNSEEPPELLRLQASFDGYISKKGDNSKWRQRWSWRLTNRSRVLGFLKVIAAHGVIKAPQALIALRYLEERGSDDETIIGIARAKDAYARVDIDHGRITPPYLAGLFAAEGCVTISTVSVVSQLSQKSCPRLLDAVAGIYGGGVSRRTALYICGEKAIAFLSAIRPYCFGQKCEQIDTALVFDQERRELPWASDEKKALAKSAKDKLKKLKRM